MKLKLLFLSNLFYTRDMCYILANLEMEDVIAFPFIKKVSVENGQSKNNIHKLFFKEFLKRF